MLSSLNTYYNNFQNKYSKNFVLFWKKHIFVENNYGYSEYYTSPANYKLFFYIFYSIKVKMFFNSNYTWKNVLEDYDIKDIVKKMYCHGIKFTDFLEIFNIPETTDNYTILVDINGQNFTLIDNETNTQLYKE